MDEIRTYMERLLDSGCTRIIVSKPAASAEYKKITVEEKAAFYQIEKRTETQAFHENVGREELVEKEGLIMQLVTLLTIYLMLLIEMKMRMKKKKKIKITKKRQKKQKIPKSINNKIKMKKKRRMMPKKTFLVLLMKYPKILLILLQNKMMAALIMMNRMNLNSMNKKKVNKKFKVKK